MALVEHAVSVRIGPGPCQLGEASDCVLSIWSEPLKLEAPSGILILIWRGATALLVSGLTHGITDKCTVMNTNKIPVYIQHSQKRMLNCAGANGALVMWQKRNAAVVCCQEFLLISRYLK